MDNDNIQFCHVNSLLQFFIFLFALLLFTTPGYTQVVSSYQKISSLAGGFTEAGGVLENGDDFGESLESIGDLDNDGVIDLAVGTAKDDDGGTNRGAVYILFMNTDGTVKQLQKISSTTGGLPNNLLDDEDFFGIGVTGLGDIDNDGVEDIAVGSRKDDDGGLDRGAVYILFMNTDGTVKNHQKISDTAGGFTGNIANENFFGSDLASLGDFDNDGITDLIVSQEKNDDGGTDRGAVWLLFLNSNGTVKSHQKISDTTAGLNVVLDDEDQFGQSAIAIGDLDNDGITDIAVGVERDDDGGTDRGAVYVLFLKADGKVKDHQKISDTEGGFTGLLEDGDEFGQSVTAPGDINNDGVPDLIVGAEHADSPDGTVIKTGEAWILYLNRHGEVIDHDLITSGSMNFDTLLANVNVGQAVTPLGDLDGDGFIDFAASADGDKDGGTLRGAVYVIFLEDLTNGNTPPPDTGPIVAATLPSSRSVQVGQTATAFATIINSGSDDAIFCSVNPDITIPAEFSYQATDAMNNLIGDINTQVDIAPGAAQNFVVSFTPSAPFAPVDVPFKFDCVNTDVATSTVGLNTLALSADNVPVPDIIGLTTVVDLQAMVGATSVFAVASSNVGTGDSITVSVDDNGKNLPVNVTLCQTDTATGACISAIAPTADVNYSTNSTASFAVFVEATAAIANDPANNRLFIRFTDSGGVVRGGTSTAVRTQ